MQRYILIILTFIVTICVISMGYAQQPIRSLPANLTQIASVEGITEYQMPNGLKVLLLPDDSLDTVTVNIVYLVGSRDEGYGEAGMAHLLEHLLFKGTERHPDIKNEFTKRGARWNGTTSYDRTNYYEVLTASADNLDWAIALEADRMVNSRIEKTDLDSEMTVVRNEFEAGENSPFSVLSERMASTAFVWHNYGRAIIGSRSDIENVPIERLQDFYRHYYQPDNAVLVVAGKFDEATALNSISKHFGVIPHPKRQLRRTYTVEPTQDGERKVTLRRVGDTQIAATLYHIPAGSHSEYAAIDLLVSIIKQVPGGRLHKSLVESKLATAVFGFDRQLREAGFVFFGANLLPDMSLDDASQTLISTLESLAQHPITAEELERARTRLLNKIEQLLTNTRNLATTITEFIAMGDWRLLFLHRDRIKQVTLEDVQRVANTYFKSSNRTLGLFIPTKAPDRAEIPAVTDLALMLKDYRGNETLSLGEAFEATPENIEAKLIRTELLGGMKLALLPKKTRGNRVVAALNLHWGDEESKMNRATACGMTSAMLSRGTKQYTREQLRDAFDRFKVHIDMTADGIAFETTSDNLMDALQLVAEMFRNPIFPEKEFEQLKLAILSSIENQRSEPAARAGIQIERHLMPFTPAHWLYTPTIEERIERINQLTLDEVKRCHRDFYGSTDAELSIVGDFDPKMVIDAVQQSFGDWKSPKPYQRISIPYQAIPAIDINLETPDKANAVYQAGMNLKIQDDNPDYPALVLGNYLLGGSADSRLWRRIREQEGLSYNVATSLTASAFEERGEFKIYAIYAPQNRNRVEKAVDEELARVLKDGFSAEEIELAKTGYLEARRIARGQDKALAERLVNYLHRNRTLQWDIAFEKNIVALTPELILNALRRYLDMTKLTQVKAGDFASAQSAKSPQ